MAWAGRELATAHGPRLVPQRLLADRYLELVPQPLGQIDDPPAHDTVDRRDRPRRDDLRQRVAVPVIEDRLRPRRFACHQPIWSIGVEANDPIPHNLARHAADKGCIAAAAAVQDRRNRQQSAHLRTVLCNAARALEHHRR